MTQPPALSAELEAVVLNHGYKAGHQPLLPSDRLDEELEMAPESIEDLLAEYFERFPIDLGDFAYNRYYPFLGIRIPFLTKWLFKRRGLIDYRVAEPLTLGMLQHAIDMGRWDTDELRRVGEQGKGP
ncbi:DUF1493 family protein [Caballeronia sp. LZ034LL]|uniref:DUF1493 family protein n=1 Tax=Caballeronia sp. LZ034LL TaxID=3038567 RepID=UPI00285AE7BC|nr:DUF1493 family protein [Caballeronia sp. LZ034LL]MDR5838689.1 DUF1493 family protein [Caballeronia sp. LZ034LL]